MDERMKRHLLQYIMCILDLDIDLTFSLCRTLPLSLARYLQNSIPFAVPDLLPTFVRDHGIVDGHPFQRGACGTATMMVEAEGRVEGYFPICSHGFSHFQQAGTALTGILDMGSLISGFDKSPSMIALPEGPLLIAGHCAVAFPAEIVEVWQQKPSAKNKPSGDTVQRRVLAARGQVCERPESNLF